MLKDAKSRSLKATDALSIVVKAKNINQPPNFASEKTADAEVMQSILFIFSREKPAKITPFFHHQGS